MELSENKIIKLKYELNTEQSYWMYCIIIKDIDYNGIENYMNSKNIQIRPFFYDIRKHEHLKDIKVNYNECENNKCGIMLPSYPELKYDEQEYICDILSNI